MPELPEVETVRRGLASLIVGKTIARVEVYNGTSYHASDHDSALYAVGAEIARIGRRAKVLLVELGSGYTLVVHLKMTGQMVYRGEVSFGAGHPNDSLIGELPDTSTRIEIVFTDGSKLFFNDQRKFGWIKLVPTPEVPYIDFMQRVGPEPLVADFTAEQFRERFARRGGSSIKAALLDQSVVAGVGNIYADESLWGACIHPARRVRDVAEQEFDTLYTELRSVMNLAIEKGGSTDRNYVSTEGKRGSYLDFARAFRREGLPCPRCGAAIVKLRVAGRGTHVCPMCQIA